ncbi:16812_t:CDS:2, partial [Gigaspora rosea]
IENQDDEFDEISEISYNYFTKKLHVNENGMTLIQHFLIEGGGKKVVECEFLGCKVYKSVRICTGAKICEFTSDELKNTTHSEVNEDLVFYKINQPVDSQISIEAKTHAKLNSNEINIEILEKLFKGTLIDLDKPVQNCHTILSTNTRKKECLCLKRKEKIIKLNCNVQFIKLVLVDIIKTLFVVLICKGIHTHPPPPVNIPSGIKINLESMIKEAAQTFER